MIKNGKMIIFNASDCATLVQKIQVESFMDFKEEKHEAKRKEKRHEF